MTVHRLGSDSFNRSQFMFVTIKFSHSNPDILYVNFTVHSTETCLVVSCDIFADLLGLCTAIRCVSCLHQSVFQHI